MLSRVNFRFFAEKVKEEAQKQFTRKAVPGVGRMILMIGNKGGVGRSTITVNTAVALAKQGFKVGVFDGNIYGPSIPRLLGTADYLHIPNKEQYFSTIKAFDIQEASVGNIVDKNDALLWKAPYIGSIIGDFLLKANWGELDYLLVDTPSGTGDIHMTFQTIFKPDSAIVVTTPDQISYAETVRSVDMLKSIPLDILGVVENMSPMKCKDCNRQVALFRGDAGKKLCEKFNLENLGQIPLSDEVALASDKGVPVYLSTKNEELKKVYENIAKTIVKKFPKRSPEAPALKVDTPPAVKL